MCQQEVFLSSAMTAIITMTIPICGFLIFRTIKIDEDTPLTRRIEQAILICLFSMVLVMVCAGAAAGIFAATQGL